MNQKIEKITVSLPTETLKIADENRERLGFQNRSELIDAAIREFVSRDILRQFSGELAELYEKIGRSEVKDLEEHLSKLSYKIAVELAQVNLLLASLFEISYDEAQKLRGKAVRLVNQSRGYVPLKDAIQDRIKLDISEEEDNG